MITIIGQFTFHIVATILDSGIQPRRSTMTTLVIGYGAVGRPVVQRLLARGDSVRIAQRSPIQNLPAGATYVACDVLDAGSVRRAVEGADQVVLAVGFAYDSRLWRTVWPKTIGNLID